MQWANNKRCESQASMRWTQARVTAPVQSKQVFGHTLQKGHFSRSLGFVLVAVAEEKLIVQSQRNI